MSIFNLTQTENKSVEEPSATEAPVESKPQIDTNTDVDKKKTVVIDGPLGRIYTQALNKVLAKESNMVNLSVLLQEEEAENQEIAEKDIDLYVYSINDKIGTPEMMEIMERLRLHKADENKNRVNILAIEAHAINRQTAQLDQMARLYGYEVYYSQSKTIDRISSLGMR